MKSKSVNKYSSSKWSNILGVIILDPDGWNRNYDQFEIDWNKRITLNSFLNKMFLSTIEYKKHSLLKHLFNEDLRENLINTLEYGRNWVIYDSGNILCEIDDEVKFIFI